MLLRRGRGEGRAPDGDRNGRRFAVGFFLVLFLLLGGLYAAGYALTSDRLPRAVEVDGVAIGGLRPAAASDRLEQRLAPRADRPILARDGDRTYRVDLSAAGLRLDADATVAAAGGGRSYNPLHMIEVLTGCDDLEPVVDVDRAALDAAVRDLAGKVARRPAEGGITFRGGRAVPAYPTPGRRLDTVATADALVDAFLEPEPEVTLPVERERPRLTDRDIDRAMARFAEPAMSAAVTVRAGGRSARIFPTQIGAALTMRERAGRLVPRLDPKVLSRRADVALHKVTDPARPARVVLRGGSPTVVRGEGGTAVDAKALARKMLRVLPRRGDARTLRLHPHPVAPAFGVRDARKLGIKEVVSSFTTYFPHSDYRNQNLGRAAQKINGTVLRPGDVFSLNRIVGERTAENGFTKGYIIDNGKLVEDFGGGVSQVATTTYNAAFFAGLKDLEHHPHSLYFDRYPMGREATVAWGALDLRFQNDTPYGVLVQAWIEPSTPSSEGEMHVRMWSTKYWKVRAGLSDQYDFTDYGVRYDPSKDCVEESGIRGFEVDVYRYFYRHGERVRTEQDHVTYDPMDTVRCRPAP